MKHLFVTLALSSFFLFGKSNALISFIQMRSANTNDMLRIISESQYRDTPDEYGLTALMYASSSGLEEIVALLLKSGKSQINAQDKEGRTALIHAVSMRQGSVVALLVENGASKHLVTKEKKRAIDYAKGNIIEILNPPPPSSNAMPTPDESSSTHTPPATSIQSASENFHKEEIRRAAYTGLDYAMAVDKKITGVTMNLLLPSLGSFVIGDFVGGTITVLLTAGTVVSIALAAPIYISIAAAAVTEIVNLAAPLVYGNSLFSTSGVALARF